jgi:CBS-domain-containing membrane protein
MKYPLIATAMLVALGSTPLAAQESWVSGNFWAAACGETKNPVQQMFCVAYARGVADAVFVFSAYQKTNPLRVCMALTVSAEQLREVGLAYVVANPKDRHVPASQLLWVAFREAWPCEATK